MRIFLMISLLSFILPVLPSYAQTDADDDVTLLGFNAIYLVHDDHVRALFSLGYENDGSPVRFDLPLPPKASNVQFAPALIAPVVQNYTEPEIEPAWNPPCSLSIEIARGDGYLPWPRYVEPLESKLDFDEESATLWAQPDDIEPDNFYSGTVHLTDTLIFDYPGTDIFWPTALEINDATAYLDNFSNQEYMPLTVHIFADQPYTVDPMLSVDISEIRPAHYHEIRDTPHHTVNPSFFFNYFDPYYYQLMFDTLESESGMVREYINEPYLTVNPTFREQYPFVSSLLDEWENDYPVLTRFFGFVEDEGAMPDVVFSPDVEAPNPYLLSLPQVSNQVRFWGCTTRNILTEPLDLDKLTISYYPDWHLAVAHPDTWILNHLQDDLIVYAPAEVTLDDLTLLETTGQGLPILVIQRIDATVPLTEALPQDLQTYADIPFTAEAVPAEANLTRQTRIVADPPYTYGSGTVSFTGFKVGMLAPSELWMENEAIFAEIFNFTTAYQYYTSFDLQHTVFIGSVGNWHAIGYPAGWIERETPDGDIILVSENATDPIAAQHIQIWQDVDDETQFLANYNVSEVLEAGVPTAFTANEQQGYLIRIDYYGRSVTYIEISAPEDKASALLELIAFSIRAPEFDSVGG